VIIEKILLNNLVKIAKSTEESLGDCSGIFIFKH